MGRLNTYLEHIVRRAVRPVVHGVAVLHTAHMYIEAVLGGPAPVRKLCQQPLLCFATNTLRVSKTSKMSPHVVPADQSIQHANEIDTTRKRTIVSDKISAKHRGLALLPKLRVGYHWRLCYVPFHVHVHHMRILKTLVRVSHEENNKE